MPDPDTLATVFLKLRSKLASAVSGIVPPKEIEDIVQETYVRVSQAANLDRIRSPESFLYRTARNLALDYVKRAESRLVDSADDTDCLGFRPQSDRDDQTFRKVANDEEFAQFCDAVRYLPVQCRRAFVLRKVYGFSQKEIAELMGLSESTVEKHIAQGVKRTYLQMKEPSRDQSQSTLATVTQLQTRQTGEGRR